MGKVLIAPTYESINGPLVFLAGPIQGSYRWQDKAIEFINGHDPRINIASPRRNADRKYRKGDFTQEMYNEQVDWETFHLRRAAENGAVMFWLAKEIEHRCDRAYAQTSRFELGEWKVRHERDGTLLVVGIEPGFTNQRYIARRLSQDCPKVPLLDSLEETCKKTVDLILSNSLKELKTY